MGTHENDTFTNALTYIQISALLLRSFHLLKFCGLQLFESATWDANCDLLFSSRLIDMGANVLFVAQFNITVGGWGNVEGLSH